MSTDSSRVIIAEKPGELTTRPGGGEGGGGQQCEARSLTRNILYCLSYLVTSAQDFAFQAPEVKSWKAYNNEILLRKRTLSFVLPVSSLPGRGGWSGDILTYSVCAQNPAYTWSHIGTFNAKGRVPDSAYPEYEKPLEYLREPDRSSLVDRKIPRYFPRSTDSDSR